MTSAHKSSPHIWLNKYFTVRQIRWELLAVTKLSRKGEIYAEIVCVGLGSFAGGFVHRKHWFKMWFGKPQAALISLHSHSGLCTFIQRHFLFSLNKYLCYGLGFKKRSYRTEQLHDINICKWHEIRLEVHSAAQGLIKHVTC